MKDDYTEGKRKNKFVVSRIGRARVLFFSLFVYLFVRSFIFFCFIIIIIIIIIVSICAIDRKCSFESAHRFSYSERSRLEDDHARPYISIYQISRDHRNTAILLCDCVSLEGNYFPFAVYANSAVSLHIERERERERGR